MSDGQITIRFAPTHAPIGLSECSLCGAAISNEHLHYEWHASIAATQAAAIGHPGWSIVWDQS